MSILFIILISLNAWSKDCILKAKPFEAEIQSLSRFIESGSTKVIECVQQEFVDMLLDPIRLQSFVIKQCDLKPECKLALVKEASRVSRLEESRFEKLNTIHLWTEIKKFSGLNRIAHLRYSDLPLEEDPELLFEKIRNERISARTLSKSENLSMACTALAAIVGPAKFKALKVANTLVRKSYLVQRSHDVEKIISKNKLPTNVKEKFLDWEKAVQEKGLPEVKKIPGFHDEPVKSTPGRHSVRMNQGYRVFYDTVEENGVIKIKVVDINMHKY